MPRIDYRELKALSEEVTKLRQETVGYLKDYDESNDAFTEDRELLGMGWSSGKNHHGHYKVVSDAIFNALYDLDDSLKNYLTEFKSIVGETENRLDTDELQELENELRHLQTQKLEFMEAMADLFKDVPVLKEFFGNNTMIGRKKLKF
ncbi:T7SS effector LXG polymorphic toxin [Carnobacterium gallinarum]|uniref:T7SS effector LXG polymorphic toxin n=1 Tax=Carnobacterium gallinarum TaxID=2749 RepID=UPI00055325B6|nr:T7SS effector LXG polymorphic toxin [Carnobacterium gallinarum]